MSRHQQDDMLQLESYNNIDIDELKAELIRLTHQLNEEKSNSKQAAEYGLSMLEDLKKLNKEKKKVAKLGLKKNEKNFASKREKKSFCF